MLLSDPEIESSILISSDEGATYQKYRLNFYIQSLLFHPKQEEWILAYSLDQKVSNWFHVSMILDPGVESDSVLNCSLPEMVKKLWCAFLLSPCRFKWAQNPPSDSEASLLKGVELYSDHDGCGNFVSGDGMKDEESETWHDIWSCSKNLLICRPWWWLSCLWGSSSQPELVHNSWLLRVRECSFCLQTEPGYLDIREQQQMTNSSVPLFKSFCSAFC